MTTTLTLPRQQALLLAGSRAGSDFLINALACTQSETAQTRKGWFYKSLREWKEIGLSQTSVTNNTKNLINHGILTAYSERDNTRIVGGIRRWYRVNVDALQQAITELEKPAAKTVKKVRKTVCKTATSVHKLACKAIELGKKAFDGKSVVDKPLSVITPAQYKRMEEFSAYVKNAGGEVLKSQFSRFGMTSHYVQAAYTSFIAKTEDNKETVNRKRAEGDILYPDQLDHKAWQQWLHYRKTELNKVYKTPESERVAVREFMKRCPDPARQQDWVHASIAAQYRSLCPPPSHNQQATYMTDAEVMDSARADRYQFRFDEDGE